MARNRGHGSISTGYIKDYKYDQRLQTTSPPYFPWRMARGLPNDWRDSPDGG